MYKLYVSTYNKAMCCTLEIHCLFSASLPLPGKIVITDWTLIKIATWVSLSVGTLLCGSLIVRGLENASFCQESSTGQTEFL